MKRWIAVLLMLVPTLSLFAQTSAGQLLPLLDEQSFFLGRIQPGKIDIAKIMIPLVQKKAIPTAEAAALGFFLNLQKSNIDKVIDEIWFYSSTKDAATYFLPSIMIKTQPAAKTEDLLNLLKNLPLPLNIQTASGQIIKKGQTPILPLSYVIREEKGFYLLEHVGAAKDTKKNKRTDVAQGFDAMGSLPFGAMLFPSKDNPLDLGKIFPSLKKANGKDTEVPGILNGLKLVTLGMYLDPWRIQMVIQTENRELANDVHQSILKAIQSVPDLVQAQVEEVGKDPVFKALAAMVKSVSIMDDKVTIVITDFDPYFEIAARINEQNQAKAVAAQSMNKVKNIASALLAYHKDRGKFPPAATLSKEGKPLLSWRVQILPYLGHNFLYKQFRQNEPWDSEHNKKLIRRIPPSFRESQEHLDKGTTPFQAPVGLATLFAPGGTGTNSIQISNELSNTIMLVKVPEDKTAIWTKPEDWEIDINLPAKDLLKGFTNSIVFACADGEVKTILLKEAEDKIKSMLAIEGKAKKP
ncbi:MAG: DUF1559 domain-containing protein [Planctomycetes bacterium]|nr:DUF1559 domain-containing protein [Planctomycetota bacterium]